MKGAKHNKSGKWVKFNEETDLYELSESPEIYDDPQIQDEEIMLECMADDLNGYVDDFSFIEVLVIEKPDREELIEKAREFHDTYTSTTGDHPVTIYEAMADFCIEQFEQLKK